MMKTGTRANLVKKINYSHKYYPIMKQKLFMRLAAAAAVILFICVLIFTLIQLMIRKQMKIRGIK